MSTRNRKAEIHRKTRETDIRLELTIDGAGNGEVDTGLPFMNHMLELFAKHSLCDLRINAGGDLAVDYHHTVEDLGLTLGNAVNDALGDRCGIRRYGWCLLPMDDALCRVALDLGGRPFLQLDMANRRRKILDFDLGLIREFFQAFVVQARMNLHVAQLYGHDPHHAYEAVFKGLARALGMACERDPRVRGVPSSKGAL